MTKPPSPTDSRKKGKKRPRKITESYLHNAGLFYLQRYSASIQRFRTVMNRKIDRSCAYHTDQDKEKCTAMLDKLIEKLCRLGLLDDQAYARAQVTSLRRRGYGRKAIFAKLYAKGLRKAEVSRALETVKDEQNFDDFRAALRLIQRRRLGICRIRQPASEEDMQARYQKDLAALARAGFSYETARKALDTEKAELEELLNSI